MPHIVIGYPVNLTTDHFLRNEAHPNVIKVANTFNSPSQREGVSRIYRVGS